MADRRRVAELTPHLDERSQAVLVYLSARPGFRSLHEIAAALDMSEPLLLAQLLRRLRVAGYITRHTTSRKRLYRVRPIAQWPALPCRVRAHLHRGMAR